MAETPLQILGRPGAHGRPVARVAGEHDGPAATHITCSEFFIGHIGALLPRSVMRVGCPQPLQVERHGLQLAVALLEALGDGVDGVIVERCDGALGIGTRNPRVFHDRQQGVDGAAAHPLLSAPALP